MSAGGTRIPETDPALQQALVDGLAQVDEFLHQRVDHDDPFIAQAGGHLLAAGGKRFRPLLCLMAAQAGEGTNEHVVAAAAAVELTHLASLYHDDVMDEAELRRGVVSANVAYGNSTAILVGDLLFGTASSVMADLGPEAVKIQADTFMRLCSGQIRDDRPCPAGADPVEYYLGVLRDKTGVLIATAARYGAMFSGCDAATVETLREFGELLGVAFQLADDILDIASVSGVSGKMPGTDLREGVETLPILLLRAAADPADAHLLALLDRDLRTDDEAHADALVRLRAHPSLARAREYTVAVAREAQSRLVPLGALPVANALRSLAMDVVDRAA